jgi:feruloyl esterase
MRYPFPTLTGLAAAIALCLGASSAHATACVDLVGKNFGNAHVLSVEEVVPPLTLKSSDAFTPGGAVTATVPFCRVQGIISPSTDSEIRVEVWLPPPAAWNDKYESVGNGGFAGVVIYRPMVWAVEAGYAVSSTDTGHAAEMNDARWAQGHPEKVADLGWRSVHETALASKALVASYYGNAPAHSYFTGCSTGGREGLIEAQRFPTDYDGIVSGAPANYWAQATARIVAQLQQMLASPDNWLSPEKLAMVNKASLASCHGAIGVLDDPGSCRFDPGVLLCKKGQTSECLTAPEVASLRFSYDDLKDANGRLVYPGHSPGDEAVWGWTFGPDNNRGLGSASGPFGVGFYRDFVFGRADWDWHSLNLERDIPLALESTIGKATYAENPDLTAFKMAGGKLLHYHGWNDPGIPARASIYYYESVVEKMGGVKNIDSFYRLFLGTGMRHCGWGPGPNAVGGVFGFESPSRDAQHDLVAALAHWVEDGVAPSQITATLYTNNDPKKGIAAQRPWCAYPATGRYDGKGDRTKASSYTCTAPKK